MHDYPPQPTHPQLRPLPPNPDIQAIPEQGGEPEFHASGVAMAVWRQLVAKHGDRLHFLLKLPNGRVVIFRPWRAAEYRSFVTTIAESARELANAQEQAFRDVVVYPDQARLDAILEEMPALPRKVTAELNLLASGEVTREAKKG